MKRTSEGMDKQKVIAVVAVSAAVLIISGVSLKTRSSEAAADRENLKKQRTALGMPDPEEMRNRMLDQTAKDLGLTESQKQKFKEAQDQMGPDMGKIFGDKSLSQEQKMQKMRQAGAANEARIKATLTPEQQQKYDALQAQRRQQWGRGPGGPGGRPGGGPGGPNGARPPMMPPGGGFGPPPGGNP